MNRAVTLVRRLSRWFAVAAAALIMVAMALTCVDVVSRTVTGKSVPGLLEMSEIVLVLLVYLGIAHAQQTKTHVAVNLVTSRLPWPFARAVIVGGLVVVELILVWAVYATSVFAVEAVQSSEARYGITAVPIWPARIVLPLGLFLLLLELAIDTVETLASRVPVDEADRSGAAA